MVGRGWGRVVFVSSESAVNIPKEMIDYGMTKTAQLAVSRGLAEAVAGTGVTVNSVIAGPTHTGGVEEFVRQMVGNDLPWDEAQKTFMVEHRPQSLLQRLIEPEEIAHTVAFLVSSGGAAFTGAPVIMDQGWTAR